MVKLDKSSRDVMAVAGPKASTAGQVGKWFHGVVQSNRDLVTALERLRDSYQDLLGERPPTEAEQAVLLSAEITLITARNAHVLQ